MGERDKSTRGCPWLYGVDLEAQFLVLFNDEEIKSGLLIILTSCYLSLLRNLLVIIQNSWEHCRCLMQTFEMIVYD